MLSAACGSGDGVTSTVSTPSAADEPSGTTVAVRNIAFKPASLKVLRGTEVRWVNEDDGVRHTATSGTAGDNGVPGVSAATQSEPDGQFDGDMPDAGAQFAFTFTEAGTYEYFCEVHPSMRAEVVVE